MAKAMGPFRDSQAPSCVSGPPTGVPAESPLIGPSHSNYQSKSTCFNQLGNVDYLQIFRGGNMGTFPI